MTTKQLMFALEYLVDANATQSAIRAGYSERTAYSQGQRLLKKKDIHEFIKQEEAKIVEDLRLNAYWAVQKYKSLIDAAEQEKCFHVALNALDSLGDRLRIFPYNEIQPPPVVMNFTKN